VERLTRDASQARVTPVILSGGTGTRLWPLSRRDRPKQMLPLLEGRTMLQRTADRAADSGLFAAPLVVTAAAHADEVAAQLGEGARLIVEPAGRSTAPAIALAALALDPRDLMLVMPSDHLILQPERFAAAVAHGLDAAQAGMLVTFGVRPTRPETGYGYIRRGEAFADGVFRAAHFVEKPDAATAASYVESGTHEWNAGIFLFAARAYLDALAVHAPDILAAAQAAMAAPGGSPARTLPEPESFAAVRAESIDRAVLEHADNVVVVPVDMGWSDVGSWAALHAVSSADAAGNSVTGAATLLNTHGCLIRSEGPHIVAVGVENLVIVATRDSVLVVPLAQSQTVADAVRRLSEDRPELL
jgi:mannose-1-phosphate guanylyltransferase/mannose-1-phosphate guanylyltransferase/mannose-6-phosphate isomerase